MKEKLRNENNMSELDEEKINYQELLFRYIIHWPWFVASILICLIGAWGYLYFQTPVYQVSASIMIKDDKKKGGGNAIGRFRKLGIREESLLQHRVLIMK